MIRLTQVLAALLLGMGLFAMGCSQPEATSPAGPAEAPASPPTATTTDTPAEPVGATASAPDSDAAPSAGTQTFIISMDESSIGWAASVPIGTRRGGWAVFDGTIEVDLQDFTTAKVDLTIDMKSAYSDAEELTHKLNGEENFFNVSTYPTSKFKSTSVKKTSSGYEITGDLTVRDVTKSVTFPATVTLENGRLLAKSEFKMNRKDFGVTYQSTFGDYIINDIVTVMLDVVAEPKA